MRRARFLLLAALGVAPACTPATASTGSSSSSSSATSAAGGTQGTGSTGTSSGATTTGSSSASGSSGGTTGGAATLFPSDAPWYQDVSGAGHKAASSQAIIDDLTQNGGWGAGAMKIDFSIQVLHADASTPFVSWTQTGDWFSPDCDSDPMPIPAVGAIERESGYQCTQDGDCHLLVIHGPTHKVYEMWRANLVGSSWQGGCLAVWDLTKHYPENLRGDQCTSADAGGFPMTALLFNADEVAAGHIDHAIRFILPNDRIRHGSYVHPATHSTGPTAGGPNAPPYGVRMRLRADYPLGTLSTGAQVVARAMQKYGIILSDGGNIALTAQDDRFTTAKWSGLLGSNDLNAVLTSDFEVVDLPTPITYSGDCVRNP